MNLESIVFDAPRASVNYAKARSVIDTDSEHFPYRKDRRRAKLIVIEHLKGKKINDHEVKFEDGSTAKF